MTTEQINDIKKILAEAVYAPSGDNSQPWKFVLHGDELEVYNLPDKDLPFYNYNQNGSLVAHGALLENLLIVASNYGYVLDKEIVADLESNLIFKIRFVKEETVVHALYPYIKERATNRKFYKKESLKEEQYKALASGMEGEIRVSFQDKRDVLDQLGPMISLNEKVALENKILHDQFFGGLVWTEAENMERKSGLYVKTMELNPVQKMIFKWYSDWKKAIKLNKWGFSKLIQKENGKLYAASGAIAVMISKGNEAKDFIETGRVVQRFWLRATKEGLAVHPVTGILFLMQRILAGKSEGLTAEQVEEVSESYKFMQKSFNAQASEHLTFMFRLGYPTKPPSAKTVRKEPELEIK
jgi:nitroreductase